MRRTQKRGFTLIELIVVLVILAILAAAALPTFTGYIDYAREKLCESRRGQILRAFQAVCVDHPALAAAKDTIELKNAVGGKDPLDYLDEIGAYSGDVTCARYHVRYEMVVSSNAAGERKVQLQCPCQDNELSYLAQAEKIYKGGSSSADRKEIIRKIYEERGSLLPVSDSFKQNTRFKGKPLYWRPYYLNDANKTMVMYASKENDSSWANWNANLIYYNGTIYQCTNGTASNPGGSSIASWNQIGTGKDSTYKTFEEWLVGKPFEQVN